LLYIAFFGIAALLVWRAFQNDPRAQLLAIASVPGLALFTAVSPFHWVKLNWVGPVYLGLLVAAAGLWDARRSSNWVRIGAPIAVAVGAVLTLAMYLMPLVPSIPFRERDNLVSGWKQLASAVAAQGAGTPGDDSPLVIGWGYKTASELAFYLPGQPQTRSNDALGAPGLAYDFWAPAEGISGRNALVVVDERERLPDAEQKLRSQCAAVEQLSDVPVFRGPNPVTRFHLWRCSGMQLAARQ
jgi:hypothetical protein